MRMDEAGSCCVHAFQIICRLLLRLKFRIPVFWMRTKRPGPDTHSLIHQSRYLPFSLSLSSFSSFHLSFVETFLKFSSGRFLYLASEFWNLKAYLGDNRGEYRYIFQSSFLSSSSSPFPKWLQQILQQISFIFLQNFRANFELHLEDDIMFLDKMGYLEWYSKKVS